MEITQITNHSELLFRITELKTLKEAQEEELKLSFKKLAQTIDFMSILRGGKSENSQFDIVKIGLNTGINLMIDLILGKHRSIKGFLSSVLVEKFSAFFINNNMISIISGITQLIHRNREPETNQ